jgi:hypothetical protein
MSHSNGARKSSPVIPLDEQQLADVRSGIKERSVHICFGQESTGQSWYELKAQPDDNNMWQVKVRVMSNWMERKDIPEEKIEEVLIEALGVALGFRTTLH